MLKYQPLTSEKYLLQAMKQEYKQLRIHQMKQSFVNVFTFLVLLATLALVAYSYFQMPVWIESIEQMTGWEFAEMNWFKGLKSIKGF